MRLSHEHIAIIEQQMIGLKGKEAKAKARVLANQFEVSIDRIYWFSRSVRPGRKQRSDAGDVRFINPEDLRQLVKLTVKLGLSADHIKEVAAANGLGEIAPATLNRYLRKNGISRKQNLQDIKPYISWEAKRPNVIHQVDSTVAQQFYLADDGSIGYERPEQRYKNKPGNRRPRITLLSLKDDHSRAIYARFYLSNDTYAWMEFLYQAWREKEDRIGFPLHGLPVMLYSDNDSVIKSKKFRRAMNRLNVKVVKHEVGNSRAKGKVENSFKLLQEFEKVTKIHKFTSLEEANDALFDYLYYVNNRVNSATGCKPFQRWVSIQDSKLLDVPNAEIFNQLHVNVYHRQIRKDLTVSLKSVTGKVWQLPFRPPFINHIGEYCEIYAYPTESEQIIVVLDGKEWAVTYMQKEMRGTGNYDELPKPDALIRREEIQASPDPEFKLTGIYKERHRQAFTPKNGQEFVDMRLPLLKPADVQRSRLWFINRLQRDFLINIPPLDAEREWIDAIFGDATELTEGELERHISDLSRGGVGLGAKIA